MEMRELTDCEIKSVSGGMNDWTTGGIAVMGLGVAGGPVTAGFGVAVGLSMMFIGYMAGGSGGGGRYKPH